jgi:acyl-CoA synthetase (AMP-forming)/AMP-acid ligase II
MYTAAFTGSPNGALLSHRALVTQGSYMALIQGVGADYVYLNCGPLFHVATFMTTLATFLSGGTNVFTPRADAAELCRLIAEEGCTGAFIMGPTMDQIIELNADGRYDLKTLRGFPGRRQWTAMITVDTSPWGQKPAGYGQTEVMGMATLNALQPSVGSSGRPAPFVRMAMLSPEGDELPAGETGEIGVRGPTVMNGYFNRPELNAERQARGWHHTNDLGRIEADGSLTFVGPKGRLIKSAAENIYPAEVEACLRSHPAVADAAVIGVPDATWGQNVTAVVVLAEGATATADDIIGHCRERIASYKKPKAVEFVDVLPRQGFAVDYEALDERFGGGGYPGVGARGASRRFITPAEIRRVRPRGPKRGETATTLLSTPGTQTAWLRSRAASPEATTSPASLQAMSGTPELFTPARSWKSVRVNPGHRAVTWTPALATSSWRASVNDRTKALVAE